jgi:hypothetical protein
MPGKPSSEEIAWAAGLFEGEGCMHFRGTVGKRGGNAQMRLTMTDSDVVARFAVIMGCGNSYFSHTPVHRARGEKPLYTWVVYTASQIIQCLELLMPWLGDRRRVKAKETIAFAKQIEVHKGSKTHCPQGHPYSGDNLLTETMTVTAVNGEVRTYTRRRCKTCRRKQARERKAKARERKHT